jgi:hypothetical protein
VPAKSFGIDENLAEYGPPLNMLGECWPKLTKVKVGGDGTLVETSGGLDSGVVLADTGMGLGSALLRMDGKTGGSGGLPLALP